MKKCWALALYGILALGLAACSASPKDVRPETHAVSSAPQEAVKAMGLEWEKAYRADLNGDGEEENFILKIPELCPDEGARGQLSITIGDEDGGESFVLSEDFHSNANYLLETQQGARLLLSVENDIGRGKLLLFQFQGFQPVRLDQISGWAMGWNEQTQSLRVRDDIDVLGTWEAEREYQLREDMLVPMDGSLWEIKDTDKILTLSAPLEVELREEDGSYQFADLEIGTEMKVRATDRNSIVIFQLREGTLGRLAIDGVREGRVIIEGESDEAYFQNLPYSG